MQKCLKIDQGTARHDLFWRCGYLRTELSTEFVDTCGKALVRLILTPTSKGKIGLQAAQLPEKQMVQGLPQPPSGIPDRAIQKRRTIRAHERPEPFPPRAP